LRNLLTNLKTMRINYWQSFEENCFYHIYNRSNNKETIFRSDDNYKFFLKRWVEYLSPYFDTYSYALIPNHFHFTVKVHPVDDLFREAVTQEKTVAGLKFLEGTLALDEFLEDQMKRFLTSYAKAFNKQQNREGSVFQKRFKRVAARTGHHLLYLIAYHHHNPIHHKLVKNYDEWKYSSYLAFLSGASTKICRQEVLDLFFPGDRNKAVRDFVEYHRAFQLDKKMEFLMMED